MRDVYVEKWKVIIEQWYWLWFSLSSNANEIFIRLKQKSRKEGSRNSKFELGDPEMREWTEGGRVDVHQLNALIRTAKMIWLNEIKIMEWMSSWCFIVRSSVRRSFTWLALKFTPFSHRSFSVKQTLTLSHIIGYDSQIIWSSAYSMILICETAHRKVQGNQISACADRKMNKVPSSPSNELIPLLKQLSICTNKLDQQSTLLFHQHFPSTGVGPWRRSFSNWKYIQHIHGFFGRCRIQWEMKCERMNQIVT
jgi:hypothetical protein